MRTGLTTAVAARIDALYDTTLKPRLEALEAGRRQARTMVIKSLGLTLVPLFMLFAGDWFEGLTPIRSGMVWALVWGSVFLAGLGMAAVRYLVPYAATFGNYRSRFKHEIVAEIFKAVSPSSTYDPLQGLPAAVFKAPGLFNERATMSSDDRVRGRIGSMPFEAADVGSTYRSGSSARAQIHTVFRGLFVHVESSRQLRGRTFVDPVQAGGYQLGERGGLATVDFDDAGFTKVFNVHSTDQASARAILTPAMRACLTGLAAQAAHPVFAAFMQRDVYLGVHYDRHLFEPGVASSTTKEHVRAIAGEFALVEAIAREIDRNDGVAIPESSAGDAFYAPDAAPHQLAQMAKSSGGRMTADQVWAAAGAAIDDSARHRGKAFPRPARTRIAFERGLGTISIHYGLRFGFWVLLLISLAGAALALGALRAENAPAAVALLSALVRGLPSIPFFDPLASGAPLPCLIAGVTIAALFSLYWTAFVRRVVVDAEAIRIFRGFRPFPRVYPRTVYRRVLLINRNLYIARDGALRLHNPTASPLLTEEEAQWLTSELKQALGQLD